MSSETATIFPGEAPTGKAAATSFFLKLDSLNASKSASPPNEDDTHLLRKTTKRLQSCNRYKTHFRVSVDGVNRVYGRRCRSRLCEYCQQIYRQVLSRRISRCLSAARWSGLRLLHITLTIPHGREDDLSILERSLMGCFRKLKDRKGAAKKPSWRRLVKAYISVPEITRNPVHGWHPHLHLYVVLNPEIAALPIHQIRSTLAADWCVVTEKAGVPASDVLIRELNFEDNKDTGGKADEEDRLGDYLAKGNDLDGDGVEKNIALYGEQIVADYIGALKGKRRFAFSKGWDQMVRAKDGRGLNERLPRQGITLDRRTVARLSIAAARGVLPQPLHEFWKRVGPQIVGLSRQKGLKQFADAAERDLEQFLQASNVPEGNDGETWFSIDYQGDPPVSDSDFNAKALGPLIRHVRGILTGEIVSTPIV